MSTRRGSLELALLVGLLGAPALAQDDPHAAPPPRARPGQDEHVAKGDYFFKAGYYLKASEHYRLALLEDPASADKKLAFGHSLFAIGNYSYASYALRRGVAQLDPEETFSAGIEPLFPSKRAFTQALRDLKRYVTYSPRDPAGLTVLGYVLFGVAGEERRCHDMFTYLKRLDPNDPFAEFFLAQLAARGPLPPPSDTPEEDDDEGDPAQPPMAERVPDFPPTPPPPAPAPTPPPPRPVTPARPDRLNELPEPERAGPRAEGEWPAPTPARSE